VNYGRSKFNLRGKRVTVLGLGAHGGGVGVVRFLADRGARVLVSDLKDKKALANSLSEIDNLPVRLSLGGHRSEIFEADLMVRSPAVPHTSPVLKEAERRGIPIVMESTLFFQFCPSQYTVGITGTKGKTTATLLLERLMRQAGKDVVAVGNFGRSMLEVLPQVNQETWVVLELSSFHLEGLEMIRRSPHVAAVTNLFPDHMDRYRDMREYASAKEHIFRYQKKGDLLFLEQSLGKVWNLSGASANPLFFRGGSKALVRKIADRLGLAFDSHILDMEVLFRQQLIMEREGVRFINDSCATNPGATLYGLNEFRGQVVLIVGGTDKGLDYRQLSEKISARRVPVVLLSGSATAKLKRGLRKELVLAETKNLGDAVRISFSHARPGGVVLFSPAAASFELFVDEFDRGRKFNEAVRGLCNE